MIFQDRFLSKKFAGDWLVLVIFILVPLFDLLTGFLLSRHWIGEGGLGSPSQLIRIICVVIMLFYIDKKYLFAFFLCMFSLFCIELYSYWALHQTTYGISYGIVNANKLSFLLLLFGFIYAKLIREEITENELLWLILVFSSIYAINVTLCLIFGIGEKTYGGDSFGTKGFVPSNNGLSVVLGISTILSLFLWKEKGYSKLWFYILAPACLFVGAKTSMLLLLISLGLIFFYSNWIMKTGVMSVFGITLALFWSKIAAILSVIFDVVLFRFDLALTGKTSWLTFGFSGRNLYVENAFEEFFKSDHIWTRIFTGSGAFASFRTDYLLNQNFYNVYDTLETDLFDLFFQYGIFSSLFYVIFGFMVFYIFVQKKYGAISFVWLLLFLFSMIAGHVLFNGMSATLFGSLSSLAFYLFFKKAKQNEF